jgi:hypothetical protein
MNTNPTRRQDGPQHIGGYAHAWREGFGQGWRDALRCAARRLPPETWAILDALACEYQLAGSDG